MVNYKRLTLQQRYLIQTLNHQHKNQQDIAQQVGVSQSTICRELAKHSQQHPKQTYEAQQAQQQTANAKKRIPYKLKPGRRSGPIADYRTNPAQRPPFTGTDLR